MSAAPGHTAGGSLWGPPAGGPAAGGPPAGGPLAGGSPAGGSPAAARTLPGPTPAGRDLLFHPPISHPSTLPSLLISLFPLFLFSPLLPSPDLLEDSGGLGDRTQSFIVGSLKPDGGWSKVYSL